MTTNKQQSELMARDMPEKLYLENYSFCTVHAAPTPYPGATAYIRADLVTRANSCEKLVEALRSCLEAAKFFRETYTTQHIQSYGELRAEQALAKYSKEEKEKKDDGQ